MFTFMDNYFKYSWLYIQNFYYYKKNILTDIENN